MKKTALILGIALLATVTSAAPARAVLLSDLIAFSSTITAGNLVFSDFAYLNTGDMPVDSSVNVVPYFDGTDWGIKIQGAFLDLPGGGASDALIDFKVAVNDPSLTITKVTLAGNPAVLGGSGIMSVVETFIPDNFNDQLTIYSISPGSNKLVDSVNFASGYHSIRVQKDILAASGSLNGGVPTLSFLSQTYHVVPEPTSIALFGLGLAGIAVGVARRRYAHS